MNARVALCMGDSGASVDVRSSRGHVLLPKVKIQSKSPRMILVVTVDDKFGPRFQRLHRNKVCHKCTRWMVAFHAERECGVLIGEIVRGKCDWLIGRKF